jgi:hypothetical protein
LNGHARIWTPSFNAYDDGLYAIFILTIGLLSDPSHNLQWPAVKRPLKKRNA